MKRAAGNLQKFKAVVDVEINAKVKYQTLLNEYLELQKDFVSKKRRFQAAKQKRDTLLSIVKFLRQKRQFLLNLQTSTAEPESNLADRENVVRERERSMLEKKLKHTAPEAAIRLAERGPILAQHKEAVGEDSRRLKVQRFYSTDEKAFVKNQFLS